MFAGEGEYGNLLHISILYSLISFKIYSIFFQNEYFFKVSLIIYILSINMPTQQATHRPNGNNNACHRSSGLEAGWNNLMRLLGVSPYAEDMSLFSCSFFKV